MIVFIEKKRSSSDEFITHCYEQYVKIMAQTKDKKLPKKCPKIVREYLTNTPIPVDGKPHFESGPSFSLSHSGEYQVLVMNDSEVGVDIERIKDGDFLKMASRFFDAKEYQAVKDGGNGVFFELWTKKEAYAKYLGGSIIKNLNVNIDTLATSGIKFEQLNVIDGYVLNICYKNTDEILIKIIN